MSKPKKQYLSQARTWEYKIKSGEWGFDEADFQLVPRDLREKVWTEAILHGGRECRDPSPETLDACVAAIAAANVE